MTQQEIFEKLWQLGWSRGRSGLWYRPFPDHNRAGLDWTEAAFEAKLIPKRVGHMTPSQLRAEFSIK